VEKITVWPGKIVRAISRYEKRYKFSFEVSARELRFARK
jgi:hypothetical protein